MDNQTGSTTEAFTVYASPDGKMGAVKEGGHSPRTVDENLGSNCKYLKGGIQANSAGEAVEIYQNQLSQ